MAGSVDRLCQALAAGVLLSFAAGCASLHASHESAFVYFVEAKPNGDPWYAKVAAWQRRARQDAAASNLIPSEDGESFPARSGLLRNKFGLFASKERHALARRINEWAQAQALAHYRFDPDELPSHDHWPTWGELLAQNGDDCDGLDLIAYHMLLEFGFPPDELYRAIIRRQRDRANHMVTLWFEDRKDPWVIDTTGAMSIKMRKLSELPGWTPTKIFNESHQYNVKKRPNGDAIARAR